MAWLGNKKAMMDISTLGDGYYMANGCAYNWDNLPVRKLWVKTRELLTSDQQLEDHFSAFGSIESINFKEIRKIKGHFYRCGFVVFAKGDNFHNIVGNRIHSRLRLSVAIADAWLQPEFSELYAPPLSPELLDYKPPETASSFLSMGSSCIELVLKQIDLGTRISLALAHPQIRNVFLRLFAKNFRILCFADVAGLTLLEFRSLLQLLGNQVEILRGVLPRHRCLTAMKLVSQFCTRLKFFDLVAQDYYGYYKHELLPLLRIRVPRRRRGRMLTVHQHHEFNNRGRPLLVQRFHFIY